MIDRLASLRSGIDNYPIAVPLDPHFDRKFPRRVKQGEQAIRGVDRLQGIPYGRNMILGHDENVNRRLRIDVTDCENLFVFVNPGRRNFPPDYPAKQAIFLVHRFPPFRSVSSRIRFSSIPPMPRRLSRTSITFSQGTPSRSRATAT